MATLVKTTYGVEAPDDAKPGEGKARRLVAAGPPTDSKFGAEVSNLWAMFSRSASLNPDNKCFGKRPGGKGDFEWITYKTALEQMKEAAMGVAGLGLPAKCGFGMYTSNCIEFQIVALGCFSQGYTCVPIYDTLGDDIVQYEVNHAELPIIFVEAKKLKAVSAVLKDCPTLKHVVCLSALGDDKEISEAFSSAGVALTDLPTLMAAGKAKEFVATPPERDDLAFIMYTSGTTGDPKGVCLKQISITIGASYCAGLELLPTDRYLSYLPLAHIFETMVENAVLASGGAVGFFSGNVKLLNEDILALQPTLFVGVPRIYQRFYEVAEMKIAALKGCIGSIKKFVVGKKLAKELANVREGKRSKNGKFLYAKLGSKIVGESVRLMISGAAPLPMHVQEFLLASMDCPVIQGYGMTENCANATLADMADMRAGHVGAPMPTVDIKLVDVPEMNYTTAANNSGEVCTKGLVNFAGYYKNQEETDKVLDADGWLHTGDIGRWNPDGTLSIIDRKKNIFKLSQGEYVAAEKIEMIVSKSKYVSQPWIYGNSFFPMLVAVVTPAYDELKAAAKAGGWFVDDLKALAAKPEAKAFILNEMIAEGKAGKLKTFELPKAVILESELNELNQGFSIANDCLTPTFKLKRPQLLKKYQAEIDAMYVSLGEDPSKIKT